MVFIAGHLPADPPFFYNSTPCSWQDVQNCASKTYFLSFDYKDVLERMQSKVRMWHLTRTLFQFFALADIQSSSRGDSFEIGHAKAGQGYL